MSDKEKTKYAEADDYNNQQHSEIESAVTYSTSTATKINNSESKIQSSKK
jgi:hypothetical protein